MTVVVDVAGRGQRRDDRVAPVLFLGLRELDDLVAVCEELNCWSFLGVVAPLRLRAATGSPVNPDRYLLTRRAGRSLVTGDARCLGRWHSGR